METKHKDPAAAKEIKRGASVTGGGSTTTVRRPRPSTPPGSSVTKDHAKTQVHGKSSTSNVGNQHVPNYLKPTLSSKTDVGKHNAVGKKQHSHDDLHKAANPTMLRRRSLDRPVPASHIPRPVHQTSGARGDRVSTSISHKNGPPGVAKSAASTERVSKVVKAVKSQPLLVKTKSFPKAVSSKKDGKTSASGSKKASPSTTTEEETPNIGKFEDSEQESLDLNVEEELARLESPGGHDLIPSEKYLENADEESHSVIPHVDDANQEKLNSTDHEAFHQEQNEQEDIPEPVAEAEDEENVKVSNEETLVEVSENDQQSNVAADESPAEDITEKEEEQKSEEIKPPAGLTVKTALDEVAEPEGQEIPISKVEEEKESAKSEPATSIVHKRHVIAGESSKKESPAYNDVIEETASKLVEKRVNKVRALAGAFETVISLEQPHSS